MKKLFALTLAVVLCLSLSVTAFAGTLGEITSMHDTVYPEGESGKITTVVIGKTDSEGMLALPKYKDAELLSVVAAKGTLTDAPKSAETGATKYLLAQFSEKETEVELTLTWVQEETYKLGKAKMKDTAPGDFKAAAYSMTNTAPVKIGNYKLDMAVPQGYEMANIVDYDPEEDYSIYQNKGVKFGHHTFGELAAGGKAKFAINIKKNVGASVLVIWAVCILISAFFLYKNRDMLRQAKELDMQKKAKREA
ncbi:MAG: hypothetical protein RSF82_09885 [Angelakisella sp.]